MNLVAQRTSSAYVDMIVVSVVHPPRKAVLKYARDGATRYYERDDSASDYPGSAPTSNGVTGWARRTLLISESGRQGHESLL